MAHLTPQEANSGGHSMMGSKVHETELSNAEITLSEPVDEVSAGSYLLLISSDVCKLKVGGGHCMWMTFGSCLHYYALHSKAVQEGRSECDCAFPSEYCFPCHPM